MSSATCIQPDVVLRGHSCAVQCAAFHLSQNLLASGDSVGFIKVWDLKTMRPVFSERLLLQSQGVLKVACGDGWLLGQSRGGVARIWDVETGVSVASLPVFEVCTGHYGFCRVGITGDLNLAMPGEQSGSIEIWDGKEMHKLGSLVPKEEAKFGMCMAVKVWKDESRGANLMILGGYENGSVAMWDLRNPSEPLCSLGLFPEPLLGLDCGPDFQDAAAGGANTALVTMSLKVDEGRIKQRKAVEIANEGVGVVKIRPDGKILATGGWDGRIRIWKWRKCVPLAVLKYHTKEVADLEFNTNGDLSLVSASRDNSLCLWTIYPPDDS